MMTRFRHLKLQAEVFEIMNTKIDLPNSPLTQPLALQTFIQKLSIPGSIGKHHLMLLMILAVMATLVNTSAYAAKPNPFDGYWKINHAETDKVTPKVEDGSGVQGNLGRVKPTFDIGLGLPLPKRIRSSPQSSLRAEDPEVLGCTTMQFTIDQNNSKKIKVVYDHLEKETLVKGDYRGRTTRISSSSIEQKYKTTERTVTKKWTLRADGRLLVSVKLNPRKDKARTYLRVFDRSEPPSSSTPENNTQAEPATTTATEPKTSA